MLWTELWITKILCTKLYTLSTDKLCICAQSVDTLFVLPGMASYIVRIPYFNSNAIVGKNHIAVKPLVFSNVRDQGIMRVLDSQVVYVTAER
ncbi:hypothetical protein J14TS5_66230 [Paenibacillus lautus]|nr:hypothetical protein J14TS5_66230 [Paenibacillus lautus]